MSNAIEQPTQPQVGEGKYVYCIIKSKEHRTFGPETDRTHAQAGFATAIVA